MLHYRQVAIVIRATINGSVSNLGVGSIEEREFASIRDVDVRAGSQYHLVQLQPGVVPQVMVQRNGRAETLPRHLPAWVVRHPISVGSSGAIAQRAVQRTKPACT